MGHYVCFLQQPFLLNLLSICATDCSLTSAGFTSKSKSYVFIAMPFQKETEIVFYFGIQDPTHTAGFLCQRIDKEAFIGEIMDQVKNKIESADVVIAELTGSNPNIYLEVG